MGCSILPRTDMGPDVFEVNGKLVVDGCGKEPAQDSVGPEVIAIPAVSVRVLVLVGCCWQFGEQTEQVASGAH